MKSLIESIRKFWEKFNASKASANSLASLIPSGVPEGYVENPSGSWSRMSPSPSPSPTSRPIPSPASEQYRNPNWNTWQKQDPSSYQQLLSGTQLASDKYNVPQDLLMDISGLESSGNIKAVQGGGPGRGAYQFEMPLPQDLAILAGLGFDPFSATASADLAARLIKDKQLSRWGLPRGNWGTVDNLNREPESRLSNYYYPEELNKYLMEQYQF